MSAGYAQLTKLSQVVEMIEDALQRTSPQDLQLTLEPRLLGPIQDTKYLQHRQVHVVWSGSRNLNQTRSASEDRAQDSITVQLAWRTDSADQRTSQHELLDLAELVIGRVTDLQSAAPEARPAWFDSTPRVVGEFLVVSMRFTFKRYQSAGAG